jgi:hypothetical protein
MQLTILTGVIALLVVALIHVAMRLATAEDGIRALKELQAKIIKATAAPPPPGPPPFGMGPMAGLFRPPPGVMPRRGGGMPPPPPRAVVEELARERDASARAAPAAEPAAELAAAPAAAPVVADPVDASVDDEEALSESPPPPPEDGSAATKTPPRSGEHDGTPDARPRRKKGAAPFPPA